MNESAALRVLSFLSDSSEQHLNNLTNEKRKIAVIGEEHEPEEFIEEEPTIPIMDEEEGLPPEVVKEFFKAVQQGSIERLEELFDSISMADPNMTSFTESLLMAAIRAKRNKVAEYLIDQLGVNVNHSSELYEFRVNSKIPVREQTLTCRDLAYSRGMMDLVDLIDITSDDVRPSIKRYIHRRLKSRLDQIHNTYLKRMKERSHRLTIQVQEKDKKIDEESEPGKESDDLSNVNTNEHNINTNDILQLFPQGQSSAHRQYKSHIETTLRDLESKIDKSIDDTGKKVFRFSGYTVRYQLVETGNKKQHEQQRSRPKTVSGSFPRIRTVPAPPVIKTPIPPSRPMTTATTPNINYRSPSEVSTRLPIRETRTSISRSARRAITPRSAVSVNVDNKSEIVPSTTITVPATNPSSNTTAVNVTQRLLPKRRPKINTNYSYIPQLQPTAVYNDPGRFLPVTLKTTATGLLSSTRLIRE